MNRSYALFCRKLDVVKKTADDISSATNNNVSHWLSYCFVLLQNKTKLAGDMTWLCDSTACVARQTVTVIDLLLDYFPGGVTSVYK